ncbi:MAG: hypothetical protein M1818_002058 [Claussenomyces sp. TS43310]|nr:MAG: hypothetical protein M1818_002058 [Claussenomyces sp. TS43310]
MGYAVGYQVAPQSCHSHSSDRRDSLYHSRRAATKKQCTDASRRWSRRAEYASRHRQAWPADVLHQERKGGWDYTSASLDEQPLSVQTTLSHRSPAIFREASSVGKIESIIDEEKAVLQVETCLKHRNHRLAGRILRNLINRGQSFDSESLDIIITAADNVFFDGKLAGRVDWQWSDPNEQRYQHDFVGTTSFRHSSHGGRRARIVLSSPLLLSGQYHHDLVLSAFFHELVHCYLIICCGEEATRDGGHTKGFCEIAQIIDDWVGQRRLRLRNMKANLDHFRIATCSGFHDGSYDCEDDFADPETSEVVVPYQHRAVEYVESQGYTIGYSGGDGTVGSPF